jgi:hypothetical protein
MSEPTHDPATDPAPPSDPAAVVVDPARPAATATAEPTPADSASAPDTAHPAEATPPPNLGGYGLGGYLDPGAAPPPPADGGDGYVSSKPLLMIGAAGPDVAELGHLLAEHGYENAISRGTADAPPALDDALMAIVVAFQQDQGIDPWARDGDDATNPPLLRRDHSGVVDARTWEALLGYAPKVLREGDRVREGARA